MNGSAPGNGTRGSGTGAKAARWCVWLIAAFLATGATAAQVTLNWNESGDPDVAGYYLYYGTTSGNYPAKIDVGNTSSTTVPNLGEGTTYYFSATAYDTYQNESGFSNELAYTIPALAEAVSTPSAPGGPAHCAAGEVCVYTAGGAASSNGHALQYRFLWSDGTVSPWLPEGVVQASKTWSAAGTYSQVRVRARCALHPAVLSAPSPSLRVTVTDAAVETIERPWIPVGASSLRAGEVSVFTAGGAVSSSGSALQYRLLWSDGTASTWLPQGVLQASKSWSVAGQYSVRAQARSAERPSIVSRPSGSLTVSVGAGATGNISSPGILHAHLEAQTGVLYAYRTGGAVFTPEEPVQYRFQWGDGTASAWTTAVEGAQVQAWKMWPAEGDYTVTAEARGARHREIRSSSAAIVVAVRVGDPRLFFDTFADATENGDTDWQVVSGQWQGGPHDTFVSNAALDNNQAIVPAVPQFTAGRISTRLKVGGGWSEQPVGLLFSYSDAGHYRYAAFSGSQVVLGQVGDAPADAGGVKAAAAASLRPEKWQSLRVDAHPDGLTEVYLGGSTVPALTHRFAQTLSGAVGVAANRSSAFFDDFGIWDERVLP